MKTKIDSKWVIKNGTRKNTSWSKDLLKRIDEARDVKKICDFLNESYACYIICKCLNLEKARDFSLYCAEEAFLYFKKKYRGISTAQGKCLSMIKSFLKDQTEKNKNELKLLADAVYLSSNLLLSASDSIYIGDNWNDNTKSIANSSFSIAYAAYGACIINAPAYSIYGNKITDHTDATDALDAFAYSVFYGTWGQRYRDDRKENVKYGLRLLYEK